MASAVLPGRRISREIATEQFDDLFDKYLEITTKPRRQVAGFISREVQFRGEAGHVGHSKLASFGEDQLEAGGLSDEEEFDEVCADSASAPDQQEGTISEVARELAKLGDQYNKRFDGKGVDASVTVLTQVFSEVTKLEYPTFETVMESHIPFDRNVANFVLLMNITGKVVGNVGAAANKAKSFFQRYIGEHYIDVMAQAGGVREFVGQQS